MATSSSFARVTWRVLPASLPALSHFCRRCHRPQGFTTDGCFRVNANGRRLDVWLRHVCLRCGQSWHVPIYERAPVTSVAQLDRLERNDAALVDHWAWKLIERHPALPIEGFVVEGPHADDATGAIALEVPRPLAS